MFLDETNVGAGSLEKIRKASNWACGEASQAGPATFLEPFVLYDLPSSSHNFIE